jgi:hypothetical protein
MTLFVTPCSRYLGLLADNNSSLHFFAESIE